MKKIMLIALMAVTLLAITACGKDIPPPIGTPSLSDFTARYEDGMLHYMAIVDKPTPCHEITIEETPGDITRIEFITTLPDPDAICAQVITPEEIESFIDVEKPVTILVFIDGVLVHEESVEETTHDPGIGDVDEEGFGVWYTDGLLRYSARIEKPTPCHDLLVEEMMTESYPVQVSIDVEIYNPDPEQFCIQVIDVVELEGSIEIDHVPASFSLSVNGEEKFTTTEIQEI